MAGNEQYAPLLQKKLLGGVIPAAVWGMVLLSQSLFAGYFIFKNILS
jgi:hypothetical protein